MLWFDTARIPPGNWPFLSTTYAGLRQHEDSLTGSIDLTEGNQQITITGCLDAYRRAISRRVLDLSQAVIASWNAGHPIGSVVCARALLETLATFHSLQTRTHPHRRAAARRSSPRPRKDLGRSRGRQRIEGVEAIAEQFTAR